MPKWRAWQKITRERWNMPRKKNQLRKPSSDHSNPFAQVIAAVRASEGYKTYQPLPEANRQIEREGKSRSAAFNKRNIDRGTA